jgi:hypothetical protein
MASTSKPFTVATLRAIVTLFLITSITILIAFTLKIETSKCLRFLPACSYNFTKLYADKISTQYEGRSFLFIAFEIKLLYFYNNSHCRI